MKCQNHKQQATILGGEQSLQRGSTVLKSPRGVSEAINIMKCLIYVVVVAIR